MIKNKDIIYFSAVDWDYVFARPQQTVSRLSKNNRVLYVEPPYSILAPLKKPKAIKKWFSGLRKHQELENLSLYSPKPTLPFQSKVKGINPINQRSLGKKLRKIATKKLGFKDPIILTTLPNTVDLIKFFPTSQVIYDCVDCHASFTGHNEKIVRELEVRLLRQADLVFTTAHALYEEKKEFNSNCYLVPNGAQVDHFAVDEKKVHGPDKESLEQSGVNKELAAQLTTNDTKIGFVGGIGDWVDLSLIEYIADKRPDFKIFMIGPLGVDIGRLKEKDNVYFPGFINYKNLPKILETFDVAICPFKKNKLTERVNPVKVYEYLAGGKAVVATNLRELESFTDYLYLADSKEEFLAKIDAAIKREENYHKEGMLPGIKRMRREFSEQHSWDERVKRMEKLWEKVL
ncbi:glycosyltransferase [Natranaerobius trueperi]|uniref:Glycosyl transferase family 1 n=1 Tax=Natranaerobius trueperi TaxID=759412 RepID=A0A226C1B3_9FIRM|nr:glycosyltransferase [Natranaerobius trueperi]OWZ84965.1 hypothetical protein CDO51_00745 [Natranaerobius trueperi]